LVYGFESFQRAKGDKMEHFIQQNKNGALICGITPSKKKSFSVDLILKMYHHGKNKLMRHVYYLKKSRT